MFITQPKIFISSTVFDLTNERTAAYNAVNKVGGFPVMSEKTMEAQSTDSFTACLSKVMELDIYGSCLKILFNFSLIKSLI